VEHDLSILDYLSDYICCLYGTPGAYGVVTLPSSVREGINIFLNGVIPTENLRFREEKLTFRVRTRIVAKHFLFWAPVFYLFSALYLRQCCFAS
jgi:translation initiation factor RLI1